ncbi:MAG: prephenate dehydrogenase [Oscillospiraceae bacterium]|jgi:prephenate dehydrogenase|nr:prephenate dehydrogenase [Oscillospiraceae bacterium]
MNVGIVGLGLIGGSLAKAIKENTPHKVFAGDISQSAFLEAKLFGAVDGNLDSKSVSECDFIIVSVYPSAAADYIKGNAARFKKGAVVVDCCGVKRGICAQIAPVAAKNGFVFIGGHPMAGTQSWGFRHSRPTLFNKASMLLSPPDGIDIGALDAAKKFFMGLGFGEVVFTTPEEHDRIIAFTSQLAHVVSSAYIKSPAAAEHKGFSAGSYKDMTRVAKLNEDMWSELFVENRDFLAGEIDGLIAGLAEYRDAVKSGDAEKLRELLKEGRERKESIERGR